MSDNALPIYPSLLDSWQWMADAETPEDWQQRRLELLDSVNRVKIVPTEQMSMGTALNNAVDDEIKRRKFDGYNLSGGSDTVAAVADGRRFVFAASLVEAIADYLGDAVPQVYSEWVLQTLYGEVKLYGYADYVNHDKVVDLKRVTTYTLGKYANKWQKHVYPLTLVNSGCVESLDEFTYLAAEVKTGRDGVVRGILCPETYKVDLHDSAVKVRNLLETAVIPFLINNKDYIINEKILAAL